MYGVIALFDKNTEQFIKNLWRKLKETSISFYAEEVKDRRPHITLASYINVNQSELIKKMDTFLGEIPAIDLSFSSIGTFPGSGTLFYSPALTKELSELHSSFHLTFKDFNDNPHSMYLPGRWIPHCTIANRLSPEKLTEAFHYCSIGGSKIEGRIEKVALIDVTNKNRAPVIFSKDLQTVQSIHK